MESKNKKLDLDWFQYEGVRLIEEKKKLALWSDMSVGKTITTIVAIDRLLDKLDIRNVVIVAPLEIARDTWQLEVDKWKEDLNLNVEMTTLWNNPLLKPTITKSYIEDGRQFYKWVLPKNLPEAIHVPTINKSVYTIAEPETPDDFKRNARIKKRIKGLRAELISTTAMFISGQVNVITYEMLFDLIIGGKWDFDMIVLDESSSVKNYDSQRFKCLRKVAYKSAYIVELTATPAPQTIEHLWSQMFLLDNGASLGDTITDFRFKYFNQEYNRSWSLKDGSVEEVGKLIDHLVVRQDANELGIDLPPIEYQTITVDMPTDCAEKYLELEKNLVLSVDDGVVSAAHAGVLHNKLSQIANGSVYHDIEYSDDDVDVDMRKVEYLHDAKIKALSKYITDNPDERILIAYKYSHDKEILKQNFPDMVLYKDNPSYYKDHWNKGLVSMMCVHPKSCGHGLNLQFGGHTLIWYGTNPSVELNIQLGGRLARRGQPHPFVKVIYLVSRDTKDEDIAISLKENGMNQEALKNNVTTRMQERTKN